MKKFERHIIGRSGDAVVRRALSGSSLNSTTASLPWWKRAMSSTLLLTLPAVPSSVSASLCNHVRPYGAFREASLCFWYPTTPAKILFPDLLCQPSSLTSTFLGKSNHYTISFCTPDPLTLGVGLIAPVSTSVLIASFATLSRLTVRLAAGDNCESGKLSMRDTLILVRCKRLGVRRHANCSSAGTACWARHNRSHSAELVFCDGSYS